MGFDFANEEAKLKRNHFLVFLKRCFKLTLLFFFFTLLSFLLEYSLMYPLKYEDYIRKSSKIYSLDPYLVMAIIRVETCFYPNKVSSAGALGLMQLMPNTISYIIKKGGFSPILEKTIMDPKVNIHIGCFYLAMICKRDFKGNIVAAVASYNAGPSKVKTWISRGFWDGSLKSVESIPYKETRNYVRKVFFYYTKYKELYSSA